MADYNVSFKVRAFEELHIIGAQVAVQQMPNDYPIAPNVRAFYLLTQEGVRRFSDEQANRMAELLTEVRGEPLQEVN